MNHTVTSAVVTVLSVAFAGTYSNLACAVGFGLGQQSVVDLGYALAGASANAEDASTIFFNPAGMALLKSTEADVAMNAINVNARFTNDGSAGPAGPLFPLKGSEGGNAGGLNWVPNFYFATQYDSRTNIGFGVSAPFGLSTNYASDWLGRYQALRSEIKSIDLSPAISYKLNSSISLGATFNAEYFQSQLSNAIDFGAACLGSQFGPVNCAAAGIAPQSKDGTVVVKGSHWGYGFDVGALFELSPTSRIGIAYRSKIKHNINGNAIFSAPDLPPPFDALAAGAQNTNARATITVPDSLSTSAYVRLGDRFSVLGDVTWTDWSVLQEIRIQFSDGLQDSTIPAHWRNTIRLAMGLGYDFDEKWCLRAGLNYEPSTIPTTYRTARVPDNAETLAAVGLSYVASPEFTLDFAYAHVFERTAPINDSIPGSGQLVGSFKASADILSAQVRYKF